MTKEGSGEFFVMSTEVDSVRNLLNHAQQKIKQNFNSHQEYASCLNRNCDRNYIFVAFCKLICFS